MSNTLTLSAWINALPNTLAVYMIECLATGAKYVGSAHKQFIAARLAQALSELKAGRHHSSLLQRDWDKFGSHAFIWFVRPTGSGREAFLEEYWLIRAAKAFADFGGYVLRADINCVSASIPETERKLASSRDGCKFEYLPSKNHSPRIHPTMLKTFCQSNHPLAESKNLALDVSEEERLNLLHEWTSGALRFDPIHPAEVV